MAVSFDGRATIRVMFRSRAAYEKFRKYILKTDWSYDLDYPTFEERIVEFHCIDDLDNINRQIVQLLQMGFEVYCCRYQLDQHLAEEEYPQEEDIDMDKIVKDAWKEVNANTPKRFRSQISQMAQSLM